jgi:multidrug efflux system membrane fusion protein
MADDAPVMPEPAVRRKRRRRWIEALTVLLVVVVIWWIHDATEPAKRKPPMPVVTVVAATAQRADLPVHLDTIGTVTSVYTVSITSQVTGVIKAVRYREGQLVAKGTPLVEIDPRPFEAALTQAEGTLHRDEQLLAQSKMDLERYRKAWAQNAIAKQLLDDQEHVVRQNEGTVITDRAAVENARIQLAYCHITAPIAGRVGLRLVDPGNLVVANSTTPLVVITQVTPISVVFPVSEDDLDALWGLPEHGDGIEVTAFDRARTHALATGVLHTIDNQIDTTTGTVRVRAMFDNADGHLFPNQFVNTRVLVKTLRGTITVPSSAIQRDGEKAFVYALDGGRAHVVPVVAGASDGERTQVQGLAAGAQVANSSFEKLREGVQVRIEDGRQARGGSGT